MHEEGVPVRELHVSFPPLYVERPRLVSRIILGGSTYHSLSTHVTLPPAMAEIVLATLNAKYIHASFGLRYLLANLGDLRRESVICEFDLNQRPLEVAETILQHRPRIVGFGVYIWNVVPIHQVLRTLKRICPDLTIVLGGPEVSYETDRQPVIEDADYVITGEADLAFPRLCQQILADLAPAVKVIPAPLPNLAVMRLPYEYYTDDDVAHRIVYVEASRGCPFSCEFCLSSLDIPVRQFPLTTLFDAFDRLLERGVAQFKFVDRTFNLNLQVAAQVLGFFLHRIRPGLFLHFEMIPDRLPERLRQWIARFPPGVLQFEIGVQTFNARVGELISRRQDPERLEDNLRFLRHHTGVHLHADLIAGLPGETLESFAAGFDRLLDLHPHEIQVGILKRLRGTPIIRHDLEFEMVYSPDPPYEILQNRHLTFASLQRLRRFARYWELVYNSGRFRETAPLIWAGRPSSFHAFMDWSDWLYGQTGSRYGIALNRLAELLWCYLTQIIALDRDRVAEALRADFTRSGHTDTPPFLRSGENSSADPSTSHKASPKSLRARPRRTRRQERHQHATRLGQPIRPNEA